MYKGAILVDHGNGRGLAEQLVKGEWERNEEAVWSRAHLSHAASPSDQPPQLGEKSSGGQA